MKDEILMVNDAARRADRSPATIRAAANTGRLRVAFRTIGGVRLFTARDVEVFAKSLCSRPRKIA